LDDGFGGDAFGTWDADGDGSVSRQKFCDGVYLAYDADESGAIKCQRTPLNDATADPTSDFFNTLLGFSTTLHH
jgi:hypothetical protein